MTENTSPRWVAGLSNGETLVEGQGIVTPDKKASSWAKLQTHLQDNNLTINAFGLWVGDRHLNLPNNSLRFDKFQQHGQVPVSYNCFRCQANDALGSGDSMEKYIFAEAVYETFKVQLWVDLQDTNKSWINLVQN